MPGIPQESWDCAEAGQLNLQLPTLESLRKEIPFKQGSRFKPVPAAMAPASYSHSTDSL